MLDGGVVTQSLIPHRFLFLKVHHDPAKNAHVLACTLRFFTRSRLALKHWAQSVNQFMSNSKNLISRFKMLTSPLGLSVGPFAG
jgi:hypothetical protein